MKLYMVVKYYLESLSFNFDEDPSTNARALVVNPPTRDKTRTRTFAIRARVFMHGSSLNLKLKLTK